MSGYFDVYPRGSLVAFWSKIKDRIPKKPAITLEAVLKIMATQQSWYVPEIAVSLGFRGWLPMRLYIVLTKLEREELVYGEFDELKPSRRAYGLTTEGFKAANAPMIKCSECDMELPEIDGWAEKAHMEQHHPEIIAERLRADGLRQDPATGEWHDMLTGESD